MSFVASAVIGAGASIISGNKAAKAQKKATKANVQLQQEQMAEDRRQYDLNREDLAPWREAGKVSLGQMAAGTANGGEFNRNFTINDFEKDPGYAFRQAEGQKGVENGASARGGVLSGGALKAMARYNQDYASGEYGAAYNRFNNDLTTRFNRLASVAGTGQTATNTGIAAGSDYLTQMGNARGNIADSNNAAGNARASSYVNTANAIGNVANQAGNYFSMRDLYKTPQALGSAGATPGYGDGTNMSGAIMRI